MKESPDFASLTFVDAIKLFREWGFQVEPGPRPEEVTLILEALDHRTYAVHPAQELTQMAAAALQVRWRNGSLFNAAIRAHRKLGACPLVRAPEYVH